MTKLEWKLRKTSDRQGVAKVQKTAHCAVLVGHLIYIFGGQDHEPSVPMWLCLNYITRRWSSIRLSSSMRKLFRSAHTATLVEDKILVIGGFRSRHLNEYLHNRRADTAHIVYFDLTLQETDGFSTLGESPGPLAYHVAEYLSDRKRIIVFGGDVADPIEPPSHPLYEYYTESKTWVRLRWNGQSPAIRSNHVSSLIESDMYVFGGLIQDEVFGDLHVLHCSGSIPRWSTPNVRGDIPSKRFSPILVTIGKELLLFGGREGLPGDRMNDVHMYNPKSETWSAVDVKGSKPIPRSNHKAVVLAGNLIILGGLHTPLRDVYELVVTN